MTLQALCRSLLIFPNNILSSNTSSSSTLTSNTTMTSASSAIMSFITQKNNFPLIRKGLQLLVEEQVRLTINFEIYFN